jgi:hypothetical protein
LVWLDRNNRVRPSHSVFIAAPGTENLLEPGP